MKQIRKRLTYANVMSSLAVFLVLGGATAVAASKIGANEIKANSIKTGKIVKEAVTEGKIKNAAITSGKLANAGVTTEKIADNAVTTPKIADKAVTGAKVDLATLGTVPNANHANTANSATTATTANSAKTATVAGAISEEFFAVVTAAGTLVRGTPGVTAVNEGTGTARVVVGRPTADCFTVATLGGSNPGLGNLGQISVNSSNVNPNSFWVVTANPAGTLTSEPFTLYARC